MVLKQLAVIVGVLAIGIGVFLGSVGVERGVMLGIHKSLMLGQSLGVVAVSEHLVPGSPTAVVTDEPSKELTAFVWIKQNLMRSVFERMTTLEFSRQASLVRSLDEIEPQANAGTEAPLEPGVNASMVSIPSSIDNFIVEGDLLLPEGVSSLKEAKSVMIALHGGGHVIGARRQDFGVAGLFVHHLKRNKMAALNLRQRLLPEFSPDQKVEDLKSVFRWLVNENGFKPNEIIFYGCSAGASMSIMTVLSLLDDGTTPGPIVLCSPVDHNGLNDVAKHPSLKTNENLSYLTNEFLKLAHDVIESTGPDTPEKLSFLHRDVSGFPPTRVVIGATDILRDHAVAFAKKLTDAGVDVESDTPPGMWHCPFMGSGLVPESRQAVERAAKWLDKYI